MAEYQQMDMPEFNFKKILPVLVIGAIAFISFLSLKKIDGGEGGVLFRANGGIDTEVTYGEGWTFVAPWNNLHIYRLLAVLVVVYHNRQCRQSVIELRDDDAQKWVRSAYRGQVCVRDRTDDSLHKRSTHN